MKKLLLSLLLTIASVTSYAQTVHVDVSQNITTTVETGTTVRYDVGTALELLNLLTDAGAFVELTCLTAPAGVTASTYTQQTLLTASLVTDLLYALLHNNPTAGLLGLNDQQFIPEGYYTFSFRRFKLALGKKIGINTVSTFTIHVVSEGTLGFKNIENTPEFSAVSYNGVLTINNANENKVTKTSVYNISGATVYNSNKSEKTIDVSSLANGIYILEVQEGAARKTKKFVVD